MMMYGCQWLSILCYLKSWVNQSCFRLIWIRSHDSKSSGKGQNTNCNDGQKITILHLWILILMMKTLMTKMRLISAWEFAKDRGWRALVYQEEKCSWQQWLIMISRYDEGFFFTSLLISDADYHGDYHSNHDHHDHDRDQIVVIPMQEQLSCWLF